MAVLWIGVMARMVARRLDEANALKKRDKRPVLGRCAVGPLMDLVGVGAKNYEQPDFPGKVTAEPGNGQNHQAEARQVPRAMKPTVPGEIARVMVMQDIGFRDEPASDRPVLLSVGIFEPMEKAGEKVGHQHRSDNL
jgi:hypothetical protein